MLTITSPQNERIKRAAKLHARKGRREQSRFIIHGWNEILRACAEGYTFEELFLPERWPDNIESDDDRLTAEGSIESVAAVTEVVSVVQTKAFEKIAFGNRTNEPVATATLRETSFAAVVEKLPSNFLIGVLEGVEKPGNIGAVLRTADCAGVNAIISCDGGTDLFNPNAIRASRGAIFSVPVCSATTAEVIGWLTENNVQTTAAIVGADTTWASVDYTHPTAIVLGSEAKGLTQAWRGEGVTAVSLPMSGLTDSLNVSVTAGVFFYEAARQRIQSAG